jgi:hypothetical protein
MLLFGYKFVGFFRQYYSIITVKSAFLTQKYAITNSFYKFKQALNKITINTKKNYPEALPRGN